ncbi:MAG: DUF4058 family protein [Cyanobacteria bacterium P01_F01_bin.13]
MPSPFPGMDPYLEQPTFWSSFHSRLIVAIADTLAPQLRPHYFIEVETRTYTDTPDGELLVGIPDAVVLAGIAQSKPQPEPAPTTVGQFQPQTVTLPMPTEIKERYLEVREVGSNAVIAVIEVLSPKNKRKGKGRNVYEEKRQAILISSSHLIEIDLLRGDSPMPMQGAVDLAHYHVLVSSAEQRPQATLYAATVCDPLPEFPVPLKTTDEAVLVNLQAIFAGVYERASYDLRIDYSQPLTSPSFSEANKDWIAELLKSA